LVLKRLLGSDSSHRAAKAAMVILPPAGSTQAPRWMSVSTVLSATIGVIRSGRFSLVSAWQRHA